MFSRPIRKIWKTVGFRLTLWYGAIFTISSCLVFLFFYVLINSVIRERMDQDLSEQSGKFSALLSTNGINAVKRVAIVEAQAAGERKIFFRLLSQTGEVFSSSNMSYWRDIGIKRQALNKLAEGSKQVLDTIGISGRKHKVRVLYSVIGRGVILQLGQSMENQTRFIEAFRRIFVVTMAFLLILAALIGWFMARRALSRIEEVTQTARHISAGMLEERVPVKTRGDEVEQLAITFNQMLDRIQKLVTEIKEMSDNIAHDLKSPLTRIRGTAEVTLTTSKSFVEYKNMAASTIEECDHLLDMINTMLLISKTEAGVGVLEYEEMDIANVVKDAGELFLPLAEEKGVSMRLNIPETYTLQGDIRMLQRMISNLLDNAIKYTPAGGTVDIYIHPKNETSVVLAVKDTGVGIPESDLTHVFERFYRGDPSRPQVGSGLGLSLANAIANAHGGSIDVTSTPGKGSTFSVILPKSPRFSL